MLDGLLLQCTSCWRQRHRACLRPAPRTSRVRLPCVRCADSCACVVCMCVVVAVEGRPKLRHVVTATPRMGARGGGDGRGARGSCVLLRRRRCLGQIAGWPFVGLVFVPMGLELATSRPLLDLVGKAVAAVVAVVVPCFVIDRYFYGRAVLAPLNLVVYNVFGGTGDGQGSHLYGASRACVRALPTI